MIFRVLFGLPLILFLPGYSLTILLFPKKNDLEDVERVALSLIFSLTVVPLLGLILNFTPFGIKLETILIILSTFIISVSLVAWFRRLKLPAKERFRFPFDRLLKFNLGQSVLDKSLSIILIASIIGSCTTLAYVAVKPKTSERFTEFYLLSPNGTASNYPTELKVGEKGKVIIVIVNKEHENVNYRLEINFNESLIHNENIFLIENKKVEIPFTFKVAKNGENQKFECLLYKTQGIEVYRTLHLWVSVK